MERVTQRERGRKKGARGVWHYQLNHLSCFIFSLSYSCVFEEHLYFTTYLQHFFNKQIMFQLIRSTSLNQEEDTQKALIRAQGG